MLSEIPCQFKACDEPGVAARLFLVACKCTLTLLDGESLRHENGFLACQECESHSLGYRADQAVRRCLQTYMASTSGAEACFELEGQGTFSAKFKCPHCSQQLSTRCQS